VALRIATVHFFVSRIVIKSFTEPSSTDTSLSKMPICCISLEKVGGAHNHQGQNTHI
jgi:hypothetical protein